MGQIYYDMNLLSTNEVVEASATDLVGQYIGHTGPKVQKLLELGLGKVLFIDEAYRLADGSLFSNDAINELVDCMTKPKFAQKLIIILAGYDEDINRLMSINPGLTSRFPESLQFDYLSSKDCIRLTFELLSKGKKKLLEKSQVDFDITCLQSPDYDFMKDVSERFDTLSQTKGWANARDVGTLTKTIFGKTIERSTGQKMQLSKATILEAIDFMILERSHRGNALKTSSSMTKGPKKTDLAVRTKTIAKPVAPVESRSSAQEETASTEQDAVIKTRTEGSTATTKRDFGVADAVWDQLEKDKALTDAQEKEYLRLQKEEEAQQKAILELKEEENKATRELDEARHKADDDAKKRHEQARLKHELERRRQEDLLDELQRKKEALVQARRKKEANQMKLKKMGVCVHGYRWIHQSSGYRCAGGSHWVSETQLGDS
jgi:hypothetical protein